MRREKEITTPAREAVTKTVEVDVCDLCEAERFGLYRCKPCGREVCCGCSDMMRIPAGHADRICRRCNDIYDKYQHQIDATESTQEAAEDAIRAAWKAESLGEVTA